MSSTDLETSWPSCCLRQAVSPLNKQWWRVWPTSVTTMREISRRWRTSLRSLGARLTLIGSQCRWAGRSMIILWAEQVAIGPLRLGWRISSDVWWRLGSKTRSMIWRCASMMSACFALHRTTLRSIVTRNRNMNYWRRSRISSGRLSSGRVNRSFRHWQHRFKTV